MISNIVYAITTVTPVWVEEIQRSYEHDTFAQNKIAALILMQMTILDSPTSMGCSGITTGYT